MSGKEWTCPAVEDALEAFVDERLAAVETAAIETHLAGCQACAEQHRLARAIAAELEALPRYEPSLELRRRLASIGAQEPDRETPRRPFRLALAAVLLAALATSFFWPRPATTPDEVVAAEREARQALALVAKLTRKAGDGVRRELAAERLLQPAARSFERAFGAGTASKDDDSEGDSKS